MNQTPPSYTTGDTYHVFYRRLLELREKLHGVGRFDDANAKLDELCRLFVLKVLDRRYPAVCGRSRLSPAYLAEVARVHTGDERRTAAALHAVFDDLAELDDPLLGHFGPKPELSMEADDDAFADALLPVIDALPVPSDDDARWSFDVLNEAFGHFIQGSFRHRKEDAQYLTPPEVVSAMTRMAIHNLAQDESTEMARAAMSDDSILVADPTCGVGSFLSAMYCQALQTPFRGGCLADYLKLFGQDKIERMVRLANVSVRMFSNVEATIRLGNSLDVDTLKDISGRVDIVLTNPPFGAGFSRDQLSSVHARAVPILSQLNRLHELPATVDSEFALLDRGLSLLRPGGHLLIIVPDKVVSASGFAATFRAAALEHAQLMAVVDLPVETFAQAGTRTRTSIVHLKKRFARKKTPDMRRNGIFAATVDDLGYRVASRAGVTVKKSQGENQLVAIAERHKVFDARLPPTEPYTSIAEGPSISIVASDAMLNGRWNASFYQGQRLRAMESIRSLESRMVSSRQLGDVADIDPDRAERIPPDDGSYCVSVLHVREDGFLDLQAIDSYAPSTPGSRCRPGDVLVSRLNPRISRVCVVPALDRPVTCSAEFAVLRCLDDELDPWMLALLLRTDWVQSQILCLTSGTSSSHCRIKSPELRAVVVPVPEPGSPAHRRLRTAAESYQQSLRDYNGAVRQALTCFALTTEALGGQAGDSIA